LMRYRMPKYANALLSGIVLLPALLFFTLFSEPVRANEILTGRGIMDEVFKRHEMFPYVFEEQTIIMTDNAGNRDVRKARRFSRVEKDETVKYLLVFDNPSEVRGVALLAIRHHAGSIESMIYLPAFGKKLESNIGKSRGTNFLGTDFALEDLAAEVLSDFRYVREADQKINKISHFVVEAFPQDKEIQRTTGYGLRRHFIRQDNFFIIRTDYYDRRGRFFKSQTSHDLKRVDGDMWRASMILMENHKKRHNTLIKIDRRVFSLDYVPPEMFTCNWLLENRHIQGTERSLFQAQAASGSSGENE
jgi:Outer membrane lipoprotein-sorting protein